MFLFLSLWLNIIKLFCLFNVLIKVDSTVTRGFTFRKIHFSVTISHDDFLFTQHVGTNSVQMSKILLSKIYNLCENRRKGTRQNVGHSCMRMQKKPKLRFQSRPFMRTPPTNIKNKKSTATTKAKHSCLDESLCNSC